MSLDLIHISWAGPERWLSCSGKHYVFEDHHYCGPIFLTVKTREPAEKQPADGDRVWQHVNAWYQQGKRTKTVAGKVWCVYETQMQEARRIGQRTQEPTP